MPYDNNKPTSVTANDQILGYGPYTGDLSLVNNSKNYDWGVYNAITNGGNIPNHWRTLTSTEWEYLFNTRYFASELRCYATVNNIKGWIIFPDNWEAPDDITYNTTATDANTNSYNSGQWRKMEENGAVFLPMGGMRNASEYQNLNISIYWTTTKYNKSCAYGVQFKTTGTISLTWQWWNNYEGSKYTYYNRHLGCSVRLVKDVE